MLCVISSNREHAGEFDNQKHGSHQQRRIPHLADLGLARQQSILGALRGLDHRLCDLQQQHHETYGPWGGMRELVWEVPGADPDMNGA